MILLRKFAERFSLTEAMKEAGYVGSGAMTAAVHDIEEHAGLLRLYVIRNSHDEGGEARRKRILAEYEHIAFSSEEDGIKTADKLRALEKYMLLSDTDAVAGEPIVVKYDYGNECDE